MLFKIYTPENEALFFTSIRELAEFCDVTPNEARKAYYHNLTVLNGIEVLRFKK